MGKHVPKLLVCQRCSREYDHAKQPCTSEFCISCYKIKRVRALKARAVEYLGGECDRCGYKRCLQALQFHHLRDKEDQINTLTKRTRSWEVIQRELDKCVLLCANCHAEEHASHS